MRLNATQLIKLVLTLALSIGLFAFLYRDIALDQIGEALQRASWFWIGFSIFLSLFGYWLRAWRWRQLIEAVNARHIPTSRTFWALNFGYLVNLLLPRAGEIARCAALKRTDKISVGTLLGTVVLERTVDFAFMLLMIALAFSLEASVFLTIGAELFSFDKLKAAISDYGAIGLIGIGATGIIAVMAYRALRQSAIVSKFQSFFRQIVTGIKSVSNLKNPSFFWVSSLFIWLIYYAMMYFISWAIPSTSSLSASSILMVLVMGSIGMVAPVQGGIGTFHALVAFILLYYGVSESEGKIFALIVHGSQIATILVLGLVSVVILGKLTWKIKPNQRPIRKDV